MTFLAMFMLRRTASLRGIVIVIFSCTSSLGDEVWSWHAFDAKVLNKGRTEVTLHSRFRTGRDLGNLQQGRAGAVVRVDTVKRISAIGGYYYGKEEDAADDWRNFHRVFAGLEVPVYGTRQFSLATRGLMERFFVGDVPGFSRYRQRVRLQTSRHIGPYLAGEWFFDSGGWLSGRYSGGLRWRWNQSSSVEMGYLYDQRRPSVGEPRHVIVTQFTLERVHPD